MHGKPNLAHRVAVATPCIPAPVSAIIRVLAHTQSQHDLAEHVVHLVCAGVVEILAFEIDFCSAAVLREPFGEIERRRPAYVICKMAVHLLLEFRIGFGLRVGGFELEDQWHQCFGDEAAAIDAEMPSLVGAGAE